MRATASLVLCFALVDGCAHPSTPAASAPAPADTNAVRPADRGRIATSDSWQGQPVSRVEELFVGRFPGVQVLQSAQGISVRIRGATSILGSSDPLYIIDGLPVDAGPGGLIAINPADIAKIEVLKDVGQTAAYGVRGANGVILITTKRP
jgi:TonB-dependent SusC/RagA subfamily outer membrane receptor